MPRRFFPFPLLVLCAVLATSAQQTPAPPQNPAPASQNAAATPPPPAQPSKKPRKVWTDDDLSTLTGTSISVVGTPAQPGKNSSPRSNSETAKEAAKEKEKQKVIAQLREALRKLHADLAQLDKQIAELRSFQQGTPSSSPGLLRNRLPNSASPEEQLRQLTEKRTHLQTQLDTLEEAARKAGLSPGDLR
jgi:hypothetical protein